MRVVGQRVEGIMMKRQTKPALNNERLAEIYRAAAQIILRKGYDATSVNDIANAVGMTKAGLYHYINGKKELLFDIMNFGLDELEGEVVTPRILDRRPERAPSLHYCQSRAAGNQRRGAITILVDEITALTPAQNRKITRRKREHFDRLREILNELKAEGKLLDVDTTAATFSLLGMINWLSRWFRQEGTLTEEQVAKEITKIALHGLLRPESARHSEACRSLKSEYSRLS